MTTTLLAVDDSKTLRKVFEITFASEHQFKLELAHNAQAALDKLSTLTHEGGSDSSIALVDVTLPDMNGYDLCAQIKARHPNTLVMVLSSKQSPYDPDRGSAAGADEFIDKPFDSQLLIDKVNQLSKAGARAAAPAAAIPEVHTHSPVALEPSFPLPQPPTPPAASRMPDVHAPAATSAAPLPQRRIHSNPPPKPKSAIPAIPSFAQSAGGVAVASDNGISAQKLADLGLSAAQVEAVMALSRDVVERVVWEVVPVLAETLIKEEIARLTAE